MASAFSPFHIFRKYQKTALAAITLLSMFAFVCVGPSMYGGGGGRANRIPAVATWKYGDILQTQVNDKLTWRIRINKFLREIYIAAMSKGKIDTESNPPAFEPENVDGVLRAMVMAKKAELMGMSVSDDAVNDFIDAVTHKSLDQATKDQALLKAIGDRGSAAQLSNQFFEAMRFELLANNFARLLFNDANEYDTPEQRWDYYSRLERTATVQVMPVAVKDFVDKVPTPANDELTALFDKYKDQLSQPESPEPGFKVPSRGVFQYFKAVKATFAKADEPKVTDEEINDYYAKHKENFRKSSFDDTTFPPPDVKPKTGDKPKTDEKPKVDDKSHTGDKPKTDDKAKSDDKTKTDAKSKVDDKAKADDESKTDEKPKTDDKSKADDKAKTDEKPKVDDKAKSDEKPKTDDKPKTDGKTKTDDNPADGKSANVGPRVHHFADDELLALADPATAPAAPSADTKATDNQPVDEKATDTGSTAKPDSAKDSTKSDADKPAPTKTEPPKADTPKTEPAKTDSNQTEPPKSAPAKTESAKTESGKTEPAKTDTSKTDTSKTGTSKTDTSKTDTSKTTPPKTGADTSPAVEYDSVTDPKVRAQIRTLLANQKAAEEINKAFGPTGKLRLEVSKYSQARSRWRAKGAPADQEPDVPDFKELAKSFGVTFEQTGKVSAQEAQDQTELAKSSHVDETEFLRLIPFTSQAFDPRLPSYRPVDSASSDAETSYLWWRTDDFKDAYVPEFADVKADVLHAWKMIEARKLALAEAKTYAEDANKRRSTLKEIFQNRANLAPKEVGPFPWLTLSSVPFGESMQPVTRLTQVTGVEMAGDEFMRAVFDTEVGSTTVAMNQPQTIAYVVQVQKFDPTEDVFRQKFQTYETQAVNSPNRDIAALAAQRATNRVVIAKVMAIEEELGFKRLVPESSTGQRPGGLSMPAEDDSED
jgi:hypothetical protein